jgi:hypothetical protein
MVKAWSISAAVAHPVDPSSALERRDVTLDLTVCLGADRGEVVSAHLACPCLPIESSEKHDERILLSGGEGGVEPNGPPNVCFLHGELLVAVELLLYVSLLLGSRQIEIKLQINLD